MSNKHLTRRLLSRKRKGSQGMTAAIVLIAFVITAAGIAFVILSMGTTFQNELGNVGDSGKDASSSAMQVEGNMVIGYVESGASNVTVYTFNLKLVVSSGQVDLSDGSMMISVIVGTGTEQILSENTGTIAEDDAEGWSNEYGIEWLNGDSDDILETNEVARFYVGMSGTYGATENTQVVFVIKSEVAVVRLTKTIPVGITAGANKL